LRASKSTFDVNAHIEPRHVLKVMKDHPELFSDLSPIPESAAIGPGYAPATISRTDDIMHGRSSRALPDKMKACYRPGRGARRLNLNPVVNSPANCVKPSSFLRCLCRPSRLRCAATSVIFRISETPIVEIRCAA